MKLFKTNFIQQLLFYLLVASYFFHPIPLQGTNVDLGHHLLLGNITWQSHLVPQTNLISFTNPNYVFVNNQWLSEVIFYLVKQAFGFNGLILLSVILAVTSFFAILSIKTNFKKSIIIPLLIGVFYLQMFVDRTEIKPELFSLLFISFYLYALYKNRIKNTKIIFILPILMILWINFHIFFIVGIAILGLFSMDSITIKRPLIIRFDTRLLALFILTLLSTLINPNFLKGSIYPLRVLTNYGYEVIENYNFFQAISKGYYDITFLYFIFAVLFLWIGIFTYHKSFKRIDIYLSILFTFLGFFAVRNFPLFAIGTLIPMINVASYFFDTIKKKFPSKKYRNIRLIITILILTLSIPAVIKNFQLHGLGFGVIDHANNAIRFFTKNKLKGPVFNNYNIGNYLEYRLYPREKIFVDGNPEQYPSVFFQKVYYPMEGSYESFIKISKNYNINLIFYEHKNQTASVNPLLTSLAKSDDWKIVYIDSLIIIFVKNNLQNKAIISKFNINEKNILTNENELKNKNKVGDLSNLFRILEWYRPMIKMDIKYLEFEPNNCTSLRHIAIIKKNLRHNDFQKYQNLFNQHCTNYF